MKGNSGSLIRTASAYLQRNASSGAPSPILAARKMSTSSSLNLEFGTAKGSVASGMAQSANAVKNEIAGTEQAWIDATKAVRRGSQLPKGVARAMAEDAQMLSSTEVATGEAWNDVAVKASKKQMAEALRAMKAVARPDANLTLAEIKQALKDLSSVREALAGIVRPEPTLTDVVKAKGAMQEIVEALGKTYSKEGKIAEVPLATAVRLSILKETYKDLANKGLAKELTWEEAANALKKDFGNAGMKINTPTLLERAGDLVAAELSPTKHVQEIRAAAEGVVSTGVTAAKYSAIGLVLTSIGAFGMSVAGMVGKELEQLEQNEGPDKENASSEADVAVERALLAAIEDGRKEHSKGYAFDKSHDAKKTVAIANVAVEIDKVGVSTAQLEVIKAKFLAALEMATKVYGIYARGIDQEIHRLDKPSPEASSDLPKLDHRVRLFVAQLDKLKDAAGNIDVQGEQKLMSEKDRLLSGMQKVARYFDATMLSVFNTGNIKAAIDVLHSHAEEVIKEPAATLPEQPAAQKFARALAHVVKTIADGDLSLDIGGMPLESALVEHIKKDIVRDAQAVSNNVLGTLSSQALPVAPVGMKTRGV